jgi:hypothetical protein
MKRNTKTEKIEKNEKLKFGAFRTKILKMDSPCEECLKNCKRDGLEYYQCICKKAKRSSSDELFFNSKKPERRKSANYDLSAIKHLIFEENNNNLLKSKCEISNINSINNIMNNINTIDIKNFDHFGLIYYCECNNCTNWRNLNGIEKEILDLTIM